MKFKIKNDSNDTDDEVNIASLGRNLFVSTYKNKQHRCEYFPNQHVVVSSPVGSKLETNYRLASSKIAASPMGGFDTNWQWSQGMSPWTSEQAIVTHMAPGQENRQRNQGTKPIKVESPLTGNALKIHKNNGDQVTAGDVVMIVEAMKMENQITAPITGTISNFCAKIGTQVSTGAELFTITPKPS